MIIEQHAKQTIDGEQLKVYFTITDYEGVDPAAITSVTSSFYDSSNNELFQYDATGETEIVVSLTKDQSIRSVISFATASEEYESVAHYAITRFAVYKRSRLIEQNNKYKTKQVTSILQDAEPLIQDAVYVHQQGKRVQFDRDMSDINKFLDSVLAC